MRAALNGPPRKVLCLDELVPVCEVLNVQVVPSMLDDLAADFTLHSSERNWQTIPGLTHATRHLLQHCPLGADSDLPVAFQLFVDGSFNPLDNTASWVFCAFGLVDEQWRWFGFLSFGASGKASAHVAEQWALLHALAFVLGVPPHLLALTVPLQLANLKDIWQAGNSPSFTVLALGLCGFVSPEASWYTSITSSRTRDM